MKVVDSDAHRVEDGVADGGSRRQGEPFGQAFESQRSLRVRYFDQDRHDLRGPVGGAKVVSVQLISMRLAATPNVSTARRAGLVIAGITDAQRSIEVQVRGSQKGGVTRSSLSRSLVLLMIRSMNNPRCRYCARSSAAVKGNRNPTDNYFCGCSFIRCSASS